MSDNYIKLTTEEIGAIWSDYLSNSMIKCIFRYFLKDVEDEEIQPIVQRTYDLASTNVEKLTQFFHDEQLPLPIGFTEEDINLHAPRLYTDVFMLLYTNHMAKVGMLKYSGSVAQSSRKDMRTYFIDGLTTIADLYDKSTEIALSKGVFVKAPYINYPTETDFINSKNYFSGLNPFSDKRPLNTIEIANLFMNVLTNQIGSKIALSFAQTTTNEQVRKWMERGSEISKKHLNIFIKILSDYDIQTPTSADHFITDSTTAPFTNSLPYSI